MDKQSPPLPVRRDGVWIDSEHESRKSQLIDSGGVADDSVKRIFIHTVDGEETLKDYGVSSKLNADREFLDLLFEAGRREGEIFIEKHFDQVGVESSTDIAAKFF